MLPTQLFGTACQSPECQSPAFLGTEAILINYMLLLSTVGHVCVSGRRSVRTGCLRRRLIMGCVVVVLRLCSGVAFASREVGHLSIALHQVGVGLSHAALLGAHPRSTHCVASTSGCVPRLASSPVFLAGVAPVAFGVHFSRPRQHAPLMPNLPQGGLFRQCP
eukprot:3157538-Alexandrium_andersonii.AAC.1